MCVCVRVWWELLKSILLATFNTQYSIINYSHHAVHCISRTYLSYEFVPFDHLHSFPLSLTPSLATTYQSVLFLSSVFVFVLEEVVKIPPVSEIVWYLSLSVWHLLHWGIVPSRSIHLTKGKISFFFFLTL